MHASMYILFFCMFFLYLVRNYGEVAMQTIKKTSLVDQVYDQLRHEIINLDIPLGSHLNVNELQDRLGVSSTPIREAVNRLQQDGLLTYSNNSGANILSLGEHDVTEIQELALTLHLAAIRFSMLRADHMVLHNLVEEQVSAFRAAVTRAEQVMAVHQLVGVFYHNCGNHRLDVTMISIQGQQLLLRNIYALAGIRKDEDLKDFQTISAAILKDDTELICRTLSEYTTRSKAVILSYLQSGK